MTIEAVLFDLDGTLVDTAPDLVAALNQLLREHERPPVPYALARNEVSNGAMGLIRLAFGADRPAVELELLRNRFRELYIGKVCLKSRLFIGLDGIFEAGSTTRWGIVTNKPHVMTVPLLSALGIDARPQCVVSGDRLPQQKPHPAPLLLAANELDVPPRRCVYVGDSPRDIEAGRAAGMATIAAAYGYIRPGTDIGAWRADQIVTHPAGLRSALSRLAATKAHAAA